MPSYIPISFSDPQMLWLLLLVPLAWILEARSMVMFSPVRRAMSLLVRSLVIVLLVLSISGMRIKWASNDTAVIFAVDKSESISSKEIDRAIAMMNLSIAEKRPTDKAGIVVFGDDALVEQTPAAAFSVERLESTPSRSHTDLSKAVRLALGLFPEGTQRRLVLFTDGNENIGSVMSEAHLAAANDVVVDIVPLESGSGDEVVVESVDLPEKLDRGKPFDVRITVHSTSPGNATLRLYKDKNFIGQNEVMLNSGKNIFLFPQQEEESGFHTYEAMIDTPQDTVRDNNQSISYGIVYGEPRVLLIGQEEDTRFLKDALAVEKIPADVAQAPPSNAADVENYDAVFLCNVSAETLTDGQMKLLQAYCGDLGGGLAMIGGERSYGLGGYRGTPVEEALPVSMEIKNKKNFPSLGLMVLVDKSGSMSGGVAGGKSKLEIAAEAGVSASEMLTDRDWIGVIGFDSAAKWDCPWQKATNRDEIARNIRSLRAGGGTDALPAFNLAAETFAKSQLQLKHIIFISDGMVQPGNYPAVIEKLKHDKVTVTAVAIGSDADRTFMEDLAKSTGGRFYFSADPNNVPRIFTKETVIAQRSYLIEEDFTPRLRQSNEISKGIAALPPLHGYVSTEEKDRAEVVLTTHKNDALLAVWHYRLGKSLAWTSDARDRWGRDWVEWGDFKKFWGQAAHWVMRNRKQGVLSPSIVIESGKGRVVVDAVTEKGEFVNFLGLQASVLTPSFETRQVTLRQTAAGRYEGEFDAREIGTYVASVGGDKVDAASAGVSVSYSPEYLNLKPNHLLMSQLASATGGKVNPLPKEFFRVDNRRVDNIKELWYHLLWLALVLFVYDIGIRRVTLDAEQKEQIRAFLHKLIPAFMMRNPAEAAAGTIGALKQRREQLRKSGAQVEDVPPAAAFPDRKGKQAHTGDSTSVPDPLSLRERLEKRKAAVSSLPELPPDKVLNSIAEKGKKPASTPPPPSAAESHTSRLLNARRRAREEQDKHK